MAISENYFQQLMESPHAFVGSVMETAPEMMSMGQFFEGVQTGKWKARIERYRTVSADEQIAVKRYSPAIVPGLTWTPKFSVRNEGEISGVICLDYDKLDNAEKFLNEKVLKCESLLAAHISMSGKGVAAYIVFALGKVDYTDETGQTDMGKFSQFSEYEKLYRIPTASFAPLLAEAAEQGLIPSGYDKVYDFPRLRFVSYDPNLYWGSAESITPLMFSVTATTHIPPRCKKAKTEIMVHVQNEEVQS